MKYPFTHPHTQEGAAAPDAEASAVRATGSGACCPPSGNTGGKINNKYLYTDPETGEIKLYVPIEKSRGAYGLVSISDNGVHPYAAITDWLNCTFKVDPEESLVELFNELFFVLGEKFSPAICRNKKFKFYEASYQLGETTGIVGIGGQAGTVLVSLSGESCALIKDWRRVVCYFRDYRNAKITRWDGAVDDYSGLHSVDWAVEQYHAGNFNAGGKNPSSKNHGCWTEPDGSGRTFVVGKRENGKRVQIYEKGQQLGAKWHPWVRWEVELHNNDREIPWEVLLMPAHYVVGSYPNVLNWVQEEMIRIRTVKKQMQIGYDHLVACASTAYGHLIKVMLEVEGCPQAVVEKLVREGTPKRLQHPLADKPSEYIS